MLKLNQHTNLIWSITSEKKETIARVFIRFQEFYENPVFKGKKGFSVQDVEQWWVQKCISDGDKELEDYYTYWQGFNIPGWVVFEFLKCSTFQPLTKLEQEMVQLLDSVPAKDLANGIVLGIGDDTDDVFDHEFAHGLFSTDKTYNHRQLDNLWDLKNHYPKIYQAFKQELLDIGYDESVVDDEIQAYFSTYVEWLAKRYEDVFVGNDAHKVTENFVRAFEFHKKQNTPSVIATSNAVSSSNRVRTILPAILKYFKRWFSRN